MEWKLISLLLCCFGFLKEFRPSEPFVTDYLTGPWKNFTEPQVYQEIYPVGTYIYFALLILVFLLTDLIRYKPAIVLCGLAGISTYITIRYGTSVFHMQIVQFLYALMMSTEVAYYTYIYTKVNKQFYEKVTTYTRGAFLLGRFTAGVVGQTTTSFGYLDYEELNYLTLTSFILATIFALFLPPIKQSIYFHRAESPRLSENDETELNDLVNRNFLEKLKNAYFLLWQDFIKSYTNKHVIKWSLWWAFATCGYLQTINYIQLLWRTAGTGKTSDIYNGAVEAGLTIISAIVVFFIGLVKFNWPLIGEVVLSVFSFAQGILLLISHISYNLWILYIAYILFGVIYHMVITIASFEVAKHLSEDCYGLIFGINTFLALLFQSLLTFIVIDKSCLGLDIRDQYFVYGLYFMAIGVIFLIMCPFTLLHYHKKQKPMNIWVRSDQPTA